MTDCSCQCEKPKKRRCVSVCNNSPLIHATRRISSSCISCPDYKTPPIRKCKQCSSYQVSKQLDFYDTNNPVCRRDLWGQNFNSLRHQWSNHGKITADLGSPDSYFNRTFSPGEVRSMFRLNTVCATPEYSGACMKDPCEWDQSCYDLERKKSCIRDWDRKTKLYRRSCHEIHPTVSRCSSAQEKKIKPLIRICQPELKDVECQGTNSCCDNGCQYTVEDCPENFFASKVSKIENSPANRIVTAKKSNLQFDFGTNSTMKDSSTPPIENHKRTEVRDKSLKKMKYNILGILTPKLPPATWCPSSSYTNNTSKFSKVLHECSKCKCQVNIRQTCNPKNRLSFEPCSHCQNYSTCCIFRRMYRRICDYFTRIVCVGKYV